MAVDLIVEVISPPDEDLPIAVLRGRVRQSVVHSLGRGGLVVVMSVKSHKY